MNGPFNQIHSPTDNDPDFLNSEQGALSSHENETYRKMIKQIETHISEHDLVKQTNEQNSKKNNI